MLTTDRLILRRPEPRDLDPWIAYFLSDRAAPQGGGPSQSEGLGWRVFASFAGHWTLNECGPFVVVLKDSDRAVGMVGPWFPAGWPEKELSWSIWSAEAEGQGIACEATRAVRDHVFADLGWKTAVSYIAAGNTRSIALAERLGCRLDPCGDHPPGDDVLVYRHGGNGRAI